MQTRYLVMVGAIGAAALSGLGACSSNAPGGMVTLPGGAGTGNTTAGTGNPGAGTGNTTAGTGTGGTGDAGGTTSTPGGGDTSMAGTGTGGASGGTGNTGGDMSGGGMSGGSGGSGGGSGPSGMSAGCGKPAPAGVNTGQWKIVASPNDGSAINVDGEPRGYAVVVPTNYDPSKPSRVIYEGAGCGDTSPANGMTSAYHFQDYDKTDATQTIQVGLDYGTVRKDHCYDNENPNSNDFKFFPMLQGIIEDTYCVDKGKEFFSGFSTGAWLANQLTCAFPDKLRGVVLATGNEPPMQPTCLAGTHPVAGLFLHDKADPYNTYQGILPGCTRLLKQNGCSTTTCDPDNAATTMPYPLASQPAPPQGTSCVQFKGCPADSPVVFCQTMLSGEPAHYIGQDSWVGPLFWAFIKQF